MTTATVEPYRAYTPNPFTRAERDSKRATYRVPHGDAAGAAANLALHVAARIGRGSEAR